MKRVSTLTDSARASAALEHLNPASWHTPPSSDSTQLQAALTQLRHLLSSGAGPTSSETIHILGTLRSIEISLLAHQIQELIPSPRPSAMAESADSWLTPDEVAARLKRTRAWVYRHARRWPFAKRPSRKTLLISESGLARWMERR